ncbi:MAG: hypothetical protein GKS01_08485 [Alphaproteobacteria bacterium]|nr:hypothetical protein [Alphaproteobacteria bacterium]
MKFITLLFIFVFAPVLSSMAADYDGKYSLKISSDDPNPICGGFLVSDDIHIKNGKISGSIQHADAGTLEVSGNVGSDGLIADVEANSSAAFVTINGSLKSLKGTWSESRSDCEGTWSASR